MHAFPPEHRSSAARNGCAPPAAPIVVWLLTAQIIHIASWRQTFPNHVSLTQHSSWQRETRMASRFFTIGTLGVLTTMAAVATVSTLRHPHLRPSVAPGTAHLLAFGSRGAQPRGAAGAKFDGALADLSRHAARARPDHAIEDLRALAPAARFQTSSDATPLVLIDAVT